MTEYYEVSDNINATLVLWNEKHMNQTFGFKEGHIMKC